MRYLSIVVLALFPAAVQAGVPLTPRPLDPIAADTFARARVGSATVRALIHTLESSNVVVHIIASRDLPAGIGGTTRFVTSRGGYRYIRITIDSGLTLRVRTTILAHELQHACEVATSSVTDLAGMRELFEHRGQRAGDYFETRAAIEVERSVRRELGARLGLQAEPVVKFDH